MLAAKDLRNLLKTKWVLYTMTLVAALQFAYYIASHNTTAAEVMVVGGVACRAGTANMTLVMVASIIAGVVSVLLGAGRSRKEGMTDGSDGEEESNDNSDEVVVKASSLQDAVAKAAAASKTKCKKDKEGKCLKPIDQNEEAVPKIDTKATVKKNAAEATAAAGKKGTKQMADETNAIIEQQKTLVEALTRMGPIMDKAQSLMDQVSTWGDGQSSLSKTIASLSGN